MQVYRITNVENITAMSKITQPTNCIWKKIEFSKIKV